VEGEKEGEDGLGTSRALMCPYGARCDIVLILIELSIRDGGVVGCNLDEDIHCGEP